MKKYSAISMLVLFLLPTVWSQTVSRGPYLQLLTSTSIKIKWRTSTATDSRVYYGTDAANLNQYSDVAASVTNHTVMLSGLQPYTTYYYSIGTTSQVLSGPSPLHHFRTAPVPGTEQPYRFWAIGDFGKDNQEQRDVLNSYISYTGTTPTDMWLWLGDNAYTSGSDALFQTEVFDVYTDNMKYMPFYPCPGNHDYESVCAIPCFSDPAGHSGPYFDIVDVPTNGEAGGVASGRELYYSYDYGNVHFISLNSELGSLWGPYDWNGTYGASNFNSGPIKQWLINDLTANTKPWVIAYFHQAPFTKGSHDSDSALEIYMAAMRQNYLPVLEQYGVDIVLCGHSHVYERSYLLKGFYGTSLTFNNSYKVNGTSGKFSLGEQYVKYTDGANVNQGTVYVVAGNAGSGQPGAALNFPAMYYGNDDFGSFVMDVNGLRLDGKYLRRDGTIQDEFTIIKTSSFGYAEGSVKSETNQIIPTVTLNLTGPGSQTVTTTADGSYRFGSISQAGSYTITPSKDNDVSKVNGITTNDILLIRRQILSVMSLSSPYKLIAADVNGSGTVTTTDILLIQSLILGNTTTFPNGNVWAFVPSAHVFADPLNPFPYPSTISYTAISHVSGQDFTGIRLGDVNNSWDPSQLKTGATNEVRFMMDGYHVNPGDEITVPVKVKDFNNVTGYQFTLSWDASVLSLLEVNNKSLSGQFGMNRISEGYLTTLWSDEETKEISLNNDEAVFELRFKVKGEEGASSQISIGSEVTVSEAYNNHLDLLSVMPVNGSVKVGEGTAIYNLNSNIYNLSVQPNPLARNTQIIFDIPKSESVSIVIYDIFGKEVNRITAEFRAGKNIVRWSTDSGSGKSLSKGLYHVTMIAGDERRSVKALVME